MVKIVKVILIATLGIGILVLIPDLFIPIADLIDDTFTTELAIVFQNVYGAIPTELMELLVMHFSALIISVIIRMVLGD